MTAPQKTHDADDETIMRIAKLERDLLEALKSHRTMFDEYLDLNTKYKLLEDKCIALELFARKSAEQVEDLKAALRYYADEENYHAKLTTPDDELYPVVIIPVCDDRGEIARKILGEKRNES